MAVASSDEVDVAGCVAVEDEHFAFFVLERDGRRPCPAVQGQGVGDVSVAGVEGHEFAGCLGGPVAADVGKDESVAVGCADERCAVHAAVEDFVAEVHAVAGEGLFPDALSVLGTQLDEVAESVHSLTVHLAGRVEVGLSVVLDGADDGAVGVVVVVVAPDGAHRVEVDGEDVAVVVADKAVVAPDAQARLDAGGCAANAVAECGDTAQGAVVALVLVDAAVLACPEQVAAGHDGRGVVGAPTAPCLRVAAEEPGALVLVEVEHLTAECVVV